MYLLHIQFSTKQDFESQWIALTCEMIGFMNTSVAVNPVPVKLNEIPAVGFNSPVCVYLGDITVHWPSHL